MSVKVYWIFGAVGGELEISGSGGGLLVYSEYTQHIRGETPSITVLSTDTCRYECERGGEHSLSPSNKQGGL